MVPAIGRVSRDRRRYVCRLLVLRDQRHSQRNEDDEDEIAQLRPRNAQAAIVQQNLNNFKAAYKAREEEYAELKALLPEQRELTMVLQGIQDRAAATASC